MSLKEQIVADVKTAMKNKQPEKLETLRFLHAAIKNREIEMRPLEIDDKEVSLVIKKMVKQRRDSISQYEAAGRDDLANKEKAELEIIQVYLPPELSTEQLEALVLEAIQGLGATTIKDMGGVMKAVLEKAQGAADNKLVSELVRKKLS